MTAKTSKPAPKPNYTFRASWAALLLGINFLVAAYYFGFLK
jgi:photosystem I 4.8kDa protein